MRNLFLVNGTEYIWAVTKEKAKEVFAEDYMEEVDSAVLIPADKPVYIQEPANGGESIWWFKLHDGWKLLKETTVGNYFPGYCGDSDMIAYSTEW